MSGTRHDYMKCTLKFVSPVYGAVCTNRFFLVVCIATICPSLSLALGSLHIHVRLHPQSLESRIYGFHPSTLKRLFSVRTFPNFPWSKGIFAVGSRWLAYASNTPLQETPSMVSTAAHIALEAGGSIANGLYKIGMLGSFVNRSINHSLTLTHSLTHSRSLSDGYR